MGDSLDVGDLLDGCSSLDVGDLLDDVGNLLEDVGDFLDDVGDSLDAGDLMQGRASDCDRTRRVGHCVEGYHGARA